MEQQKPPQQQQQRYKRSILNVLITNVPGAREYVGLLFAVMTIFLGSVLVSSYLFIKGIQIGHYAETVISSKVYVVLGVWGLVWLASFLYAARVVLFISYRVAGPIKRMERVLDEILNGKESTMTLRDRDALSGVAKRINLLMLMLKSEKMKEQQLKYENYQHQNAEFEQKNREFEEKSRPHE